MRAKEDQPAPETAAPATGVLQAVAQTPGAAPVANATQTSITPSTTPSVPVPVAAPVAPPSKPPAQTTVAPPVAPPMPAPVATPVLVSPLPQPQPQTQPQPQPQTQPQPQPQPLPPPVAVAPPQPPLAPPQLTGAQALRQLFEQRDGKRRVQVQLGKNPMRIGQDRFDLSVQSDRAGYVYVASAGSDNQSLVLLFPNELDGHNRIESGQQLLLPRPSWPIKAAGPAGRNSLLVLVSDSPRDISRLGKAPGSPFARNLNDVQGRAQWGLLMGQSASSGQAACHHATARPNPTLCSDAYGAAWLSVDEVP